MYPVQNNSNCGCENNTTPPVTVPAPPECLNGEVCVEITDAHCIKYNGNDITQVGIETGMRLDEILVTVFNVKPRLLVAKVKQTDSLAAPTVTAFENTISAFTTQRLGIGDYTITFTSTAVTPSKVHIAGMGNYDAPVTSYGLFVGTSAVKGYYNFYIDAIDGHILHLKTFNESFAPADIVTITSTTFELYLPEVKAYY